jgi:hypothetical protein
LRSCKDKDKIKLAVKENAERKIGVKDALDRQINTPGDV